MKYSVTYNVTIQHTMEIEADSYQEAKDLINSLTNEDVMQDFADSLPKELYADSMYVANIYDDNGTCHYDGIGIM